jgi:hypothetical protein
MEPKIEIHTDCCLNVGKEDVQKILDQVTALISAAVLRAVAQSENTDEAA